MRFREPAFYVSLAEAVIAMLLSFGLIDLSAGQVALIMAVVMAGLGLVTAYVTNNTLLGAGVGFAKAVLALIAGFGLTLTEPQTAGIIAVVSVVLGAYNRSQTSPAEKGSFALVPAAPFVPQQAAGDQSIPGAAAKRQAVE